MDYLTCKRESKMPFSAPEPRMPIVFLCKTEADWVDLQRRSAEINNLDAVQIRPRRHNLSKGDAVDFSRTISSDSADLDDEEWVEPIPSTKLEPAPPAFPPPPPPSITKAKSSGGAKSRKGKEAREYVPFPSNMRRKACLKTARGVYRNEHCVGVAGAYAERRWQGRYCA
jgi:hypothetical protein